MENKISLGGDYPLCASYINNQFVFGCRNGILSVKSEDGLSIVSSQSHKSNICCLSTIRLKNQVVLASGSDHGCNSVIIWETKTWKPIDRFDQHTAAVSSVVDLQDFCHVLSTGYDRKVNVYDL